MKLATAWRDCLRTLLILVGLGSVGLVFDGRPHFVGDTADPQAFASARALAHLQVIASKPHPSGSAELAEVRTYLMAQIRALGLEALTQDNADPADPATAPTYVNVLTRLKGTESRHTLVLVAHYDARQDSFGAGDDGAAVAAMLETMRALKEGPKLRNDLIFLFTDGEELGLLGAQLFAREHPWAKEVDLAFNFEGRGCKGPVLMFESTDHNRWLVDEYRKSTPYAVATSISYDIYKRMPNNTDFTVFKHMPGVQGLNFAFIGGPYVYHSPRDRVENLSPTTLRHMGLQMLAVARHFGNLEPGHSTVTDVYFRVPLLGFDRYSAALVVPLLLVVGLGLLVAIGLTLKRGRHGLLKLMLGFLMALALLVASVLVAWASWQLFALVVQPDMGGKAGHPSHAEVYFFGFLLMGLASVWLGSHGLRRWLPAELIELGGLLLWLILTATTSLYLPGGSYLYTLPLVGSCLALLVAHRLASERLRRLFLALCDLTVLWLFLPFAALFHLALAYPVPALLTGLHAGLLGLLLLPRISACREGAKIFGWGSALAGVLILVLLAMVP